ncbi:hypothetical protein HG436_001385 [Candidatus Saccharibacteria bacterium]|nr:hypothetical protein [Candidatus Saccharibacteria bacterium]
MNVARFFYYVPQYFSRPTPFSRAVYMPIDKMFGNARVGYSNDNPFDDH